MERIEEMRNGVTNNQDSGGVLVAETLGSFAVAAAYFAASRHLIAPGARESEIFPTPMPYTRAGGGRLSRRLHSCVYGLSLKPQSASGIADGSRVTLLVTVPASAMRIAYDDPELIDVFLGQMPGSSATLELELHARRIRGRLAVAAGFVRGHVTEAWYSAFERQKCFIVPKRVFEFIWFLSQATNVTVRSSTCRGDTQTDLLVEPIRSFAAELQARLPQAEPVDAVGIRRGVTAATRSAGTIVSRQRAEGGRRQSRSKSRHVARKDLVDMASAVDIVAGQRSEILLSINACMESGIATRDQFAHDIDISTGAVGPHMRLTLWWGCGEKPDYYNLWSKAIRRSTGSLKGVAATAYARTSVTDLVLAAIALADQPPGVLERMAAQSTQLCDIAETYYRVWRVVQSLCPMEFLAEMV